MLIDPLTQLLRTNHANLKPETPLLFIMSPAQTPPRQLYQACRGLITLSDRQHRTKSRHVENERKVGNRRESRNTKETGNKEKQMGQKEQQHGDGNENSASHVGAQELQSSDVLHIN